MFEQYDAIGQHRFYDSHGHSIDSFADLTNMASFDSVVSGPVEFAEMLAARDEFINCVTRHLFAYGTGNDGVQSSQCEVTNITQNLNQNSSFSDIIRGVVTSPALSTRVAEAAQ